MTSRRHGDSRLVAAIGAASLVAGGVLALIPNAVAQSPEFDLVAHQGGPGQTGTGESLEAFGNALEVGVSTLEFDIGITKDHQPVVWHDEVIESRKCHDTPTAVIGDPQYPYVGKLVHDLTLAEIRTLDCGNKIATLSEVFDLTRRYDADVRYDIETKVDAGQPCRTAPPEEFVEVILAGIRAAGRLDRVEIESFDWRTLPLVHQAEPSIPLVALWNDHTWAADSPWLAGMNPTVAVDPVVGARTVDATILSPEFGLADRALVDRAHALGLSVVPWTVDHAEDMRTQIADGVDGIITNYPAVLRGVLAESGMPLPQTYRH